MPIRSQNGLVRQPHLAVFVQYRSVGHGYIPILVRHGPPPIGQSHAPVRELDRAVGQLHRAVRLDHHPVGKARAAVGRDLGTRWKHLPSLPVREGAVQVQDVAVREVHLAVLGQLGPIRELVRAVRVGVDVSALGGDQQPVGHELRPVRHRQHAVGPQHHPVGQRGRAVRGHVGALRHLLAEDALLARVEPGDGVGRGGRAGGQHRAVLPLDGAVLADDGAVRQDEVPIGGHDAAVGHDRRPVRELDAPGDPRLDHRAIPVGHGPVRVLARPIRELHGAVRVDDHAVGQPPGGR
mmetsp:Transcript_62977/g.103964  ORF Transcript_62977/g.103964 Transcript_62977/m.103964 type:complete len:294 (+) Transcript_62977:1180-2061(+)